MSAEDLRRVMLKLTDTLSRDIITTEAMAGELAGAAVSLSDQSEAEAIRDIAVWKWVKAMELRGQLAALHEHYAARFHSET